MNATIPTSLRRLSHSRWRSGIAFDRLINAISRLTKAIIRAAIKTEKDADKKKAKETSEAV
jgi:hypothetical protein